MELIEYFENLMWLIHSRMLARIQPSLCGVFSVFKFKIKFIFFIILGFSSIGFSQQNYFFTLSTIKARPLAIGGAYTSIEDDIVSTSYNPATLSLYRFSKDHRFTLYLNPVAPATIYYEHFQGDQQNQQKQDELVKTAALLMKSLVFTGKSIDVALIFNEQLIDKNYLFNQKKFFQNCDLWENSYHSLVTRIKLADRVSIGASGSYYVKKINDEVHQGWGFSYGILLKPSTRMNVGLAFVDFPNDMPEIRVPLERMADQTMNIGISYKPASSTTLSLDLRNLTEDRRKGVREAHLGFEQNLFSILSIRGGYFKERFADVHTFSGGIGLIDSNLMFADDNHFNHSQFFLNYSFVFQQNKNQFFRWHLLSLLIRI